MRSAKSALVRVLAVDVRNRPHASEQSFHFQIAACFFQSLVDEFPDTAILLEISRDKLLRFGGFDAQILRQPKRREAIDNSEVHDFGLAPMIGSDHQRRNSEHLRSSQRMNIVATTIGLNQQRIVREVRQQA